MDEVRKPINSVCYFRIDPNSETRVWELTPVLSVVT
jgi:hypothetical protein